MNSNPELEAALRADPDDRSAWSVYADWLQAQGDPRGELAAVQLALAGKPGPDADAQRAREQALLAEHATTFMPIQLSDQIAAHQSGRPKRNDRWRIDHWELGVTSVSWHAGFFKELRLSKARDDSYSPVSLLDLVQATLTHPSAKFLRSLTIGPLGEHPYEYEDIAAAIADADLQCLRHFSMADFSHSDTELSWSYLGDLSGIFAQAKNLVTVRLHGGHWTTGALDLPRCRSFSVYTGGLSKESVLAIANAKWPELVNLDLMFGSSDYGAGGGVAEIQSILDGDNFPKLTKLGLKNAEFTNELAVALPKSRIAKRIEALDLSMGVLTEKGAEELAFGAKAFEKLEALNVEDNLLPTDSAPLLKAAFPFVRFGEHEKREDLEYDDEDVDEEDWHYFVSVGE